MKIAMFADSRFITDGAGNYHTTANLRRAMLHAIADRCDRLILVCRLSQGDLSHVPSTDLIRHPKIEFCGVPCFRGMVGSCLVRKTILAQSRRAMEGADACVMRFGSNISCIAQPLAKRLGKPCLGHVVGEFDLEVRSNPKHVPVPGLRQLVALVQLRRNRAAFRACELHCGVTKSIAGEYAPPGCAIHQVINSHLSPECYSPPKRRSGRPLRAIWSGRILEFKNPHGFLRAAARLREDQIEIQPVVVGEGPFRPRLEAISRELGFNGITEFTGRIESRSELWDCYRSADLGFMLSLSEGLPLAAIEMMSVGLPLLAADLDYMKPVITDGVEGLLVDPTDPDAITEKLRILATDPERRYKMGLAAFERAQRWSAASQAQKLIDLASSLVGECAG